MISQQFIEYVTNLGLKIDHNPKDPIAPITLYVDLDSSGRKQAYKHFGSEEDAVEHIKNGWFFGNQGIWDKYINKFPDRCDLV